MSHKNNTSLNANTFGELFQSNYKRLFALGYKMSKDKALTKDTIQALFLELWEKRKQLNDVKHWNAYLRKSYYRKMLHTLQQQKKQRSLITESQSFSNQNTASYEDLLIALQDETQRNKHLQSALQQLPPQERTALHLRFYKGMSYDEIASNMGKSKQTIYNQVFSAIKRLRKTL